MLWLTFRKISYFKVGRRTLSILYTSQTMFTVICYFSVSCLFLDHWFSIFFSTILYDAKRNERSWLSLLRSQLELTLIKVNPILIFQYVKSNYKDFPIIRWKLPYPEPKGQHIGGCRTRQGRGEVCCFCHTKRGGYHHEMHSFLVQPKGELGQSAALVHGTKSKGKRKGVSVCVCDPNYKET